MDAMTSDFRVQDSVSIFPPPLPNPAPPSPCAIPLDALFDVETGFPRPGIAPVRTDRKSHARKRSDGHVKRPRNIWILFRSDYVYAHKVRRSCLETESLYLQTGL